MAEENAAKPFYSVLVLAFVCSALVAGAAVGLRPKHEANRVEDRKKHILYAANLFEKGKSIEEMFSPIETRIVELATGEFVPNETVQPESYQQLKSAFSDETGRRLSSGEDIAKLRRLEKYSLVYLVNIDNKTEQIILPVRGKGLWSTMYAYVALDGDLTSIRGVSFYEHGETPGLGGEVSNRRWQDGWRGKKVYSDAGEIELQVVKGKGATKEPEMSYQIDGLSGATITTKGVNSLMEFWFGDHGFKPFFTHLKNKEKNNG
ncbi:MAG: Na(+)-translocating NADH-quinone reductase subunit C [Gammaproteobacteria bacterium]|nr:Na(+)-translocating NADH-quinone reductase subunit C [Gammaproteobacteria bacterium]